MKINIQKILLLLLLGVGAGCESFLDEKPDKKLVVPTALQDFQALLDNHSQISYAIPLVGESSADNYYLTDADWAGISQEEYRRMYTWEKENLFPAGSNDWNAVYRPVYAANVVLEGLDGITKDAANATQWNNLKGQALYHRGAYFYHAAVTWSPAYDQGSASTDLGIPLRLVSDFNVPSVRASVQQTYDRILADLKEAVYLLPAEVVHPIRPSRPAAYAMLARTYLAMRNYEQAALYADSTLQLRNQLLDYNTLNAAANYPIPAYNKEVIIENIFNGSNSSIITRGKVVPELYNSYAADDLRKTIFFRRMSDGTYTFKGSYEGSMNPFAGIATDEIYLTRAEAYAHTGKVDDAMHDLNTLLETRWKAGTFVPFTANTKEEALEIILQERRKELLMRGLRWPDLKRLNKEGAGITLTRTVDGQTYTLPPNDPRYALPIPDDVIAISGMPQNPR